MVSGFMKEVSFVLGLEFESYSSIINKETSFLVIVFNIYASIARRNFQEGHVVFRSLHLEYTA